MTPSLLPALDVHILDVWMDESTLVVMIAGTPQAPETNESTEFSCVGADIEMSPKSAPYVENGGAL
jgi:hypothetical protein